MNSESGVVQPYGVPGEAPQQCFLAWQSTSELCGRLQCALRYSVSRSSVGGRPAQRAPAFVGRRQDGTAMGTCSLREPAISRGTMTRSACGTTVKVIGVCPIGSAST
jgi:hypothetical protein